MTIASRLRLASLSLALLGVALLSAAGTSAERLTSGPRPKNPDVKAIPVGEEVRTGSNQRRRLLLTDGSILYVNQSTSLKVVAERRLKLTAGKTPEKVEEDLMRLVPQERWVSFSHQLIWFGRKICVARKPLCAECPLEPICDSPDKTV